MEILGEPPCASRVLPGILPSFCGPIKFKSKIKLLCMLFQPTHRLEKVINGFADTAPAADISFIGTFVPSVAGFAGCYLTEMAEARPFPLCILGILGAGGKAASP